MLYPTTSFELLALQTNATLYCGAVAEPIKDSTVGEFEALLTNVTLAVALPELVGANVSWYDTLVPAAMVSGSNMPPTENCDPLTPTDDTVTAVLPALRVPV
jgi:hypothetical protein